MRMIIKNKKTGKSYSVITKDSKKRKYGIKDMSAPWYQGSSEDQFKKYFKNSLEYLAKRIGCDPEDITNDFTNVEIRWKKPFSIKKDNGETMSIGTDWIDKNSWSDLRKKANYALAHWTDLFDPEWFDETVDTGVDLSNIEFRVKNSPVKDSEEEVEEVEEKTTEKVEDKKATLSDEEIEQVKELLELLPEIKGLLKDQKSSDEESEEEIEEESEETEEVEDADSDDVLLENEEEDEFLDEDEEIVSEEDEEEIHDSKASIGSIEKSVVDSNTLDKELDVANTFDLRYKTQLKK